MKSSRMPVRFLTILVLLVGACATPSPRSVTITPGEGGGPRILCVCAHPDDETTFAATLYKISTFLDGACDLVTITNGEGGFKYSTLAEGLYGLELTDEAVGRAHLPAIRERELVEGLRYLGLRRLYLLDETDHRYSQDPLEVLGPEAEVWDLAEVRADLDRILARGRYDLVLTLAPTPTTHGHHQAATLLALEAVARLPEEQRPDVLAARTREEGDGAGELAPLPGFPTTELLPGSFTFDRTQAFGHRDRLDYRIVVDWVIAAHKSQGTMQTFMRRGTAEEFRVFALSPPGALERTGELFERLERPQFPVRSYGESAGTNAGSGAR